MKSVFADTFYFFALLNTRDEAHAKAIAFSQAFQGRMVTTDWVLTEVADGLAKPPRRSVFGPLREDLLANPAVTVVDCSKELLSAGIEMYVRRPDKEWSLTDCISFVVMGQQGTTEALTGDHHFAQAGFVALLQ